MPLTPETDLNRVLETLLGLHPKKIDLSLGRMGRLLAALDHPEQKLPPVIHVAGTNGKGSTVAFLRSILEATGLKVHVYTSPHLVSFRERIRLAGDLVSESELIDFLRRTQKANGDSPITFFEVTTAAAFLAFTETPADVLILEVGLGGRLDATNVVTPLVSVITPIGLDHAEFLGDNLAGVAAEKAGIIKPGVPVVTAPQEDAVMTVLHKTADQMGASLKRTETMPDSPPLGLRGAHQKDNAAVAVAAIKAQSHFQISEEATANGLAKASWPARMQALNPTDFGLPQETKLWLDGGHNPLAGQVIGEFFEARLSTHRSAIIGMMANKDAAGFLKGFADHFDRIIAVPVPGEENGADPRDIAKAGQTMDLQIDVADSIETALQSLSPDTAEVLITGSLYLAGAVLQKSGADLA